MRHGTSASEIRRAVGRLALEDRTVPKAERRAVIESRLPSHEWPARALEIVAVDVQSGEPRVCDRTSGVRSGANADYAAEASRVVVIVPLGPDLDVPE